MKHTLRLISLLLALVLLCGCGSAGRVEVPDTNGDGKLTCTLEVRCDVLLSCMDRLTEGKQALVPADGIILPETQVEFSAGDSVFDVFRSVLRQNTIHFEYTDANIYSSVYIEGIGNLYEYDCGPQSGWMYSVNGNYPGLGCSSYILADGDQIVFVYTCDLGADVGKDMGNES